MLALLCALVLSADPTVQVREPHERQVIQRADGATTEVPIEVTATAGIGRLVASARLSSGGPEIAHVELDLSRAGGADPKQGRYLGNLSLPAGGWYRLSVTVDGIAGPVELAHVERFGVGEVFVVAGQSNSTNSGEVKIPSQDDRVSAFDGAKWSLAADPMPGVQDGSGGGSPWPTCGKELVAAYGVPVAFASCGFGGTSLLQWQKDSKPLDGKKDPLYAELERRVKALGSFRAILWHQGESDAGGGMSTADYVAKFSTMRTALAKDTSNAAPWIVAHVSFVPGLEKAKMDAIRAAQEQLWKEKFALEGPDTDDLLGAMRHSVDKIHFSKAGLEAHGKRWAERIVALFPKR